MNTILILLMSLATTLPQQADTTVADLPADYKVFYDNDTVDILVVGKQDNQLFGTPRNDGTLELELANINYLRGNYKDLIRVFDRALSYERVVELNRINPDGQIGLLLYFLPEPRLSEIYFGFIDFGKNIPLEPDEFRAIAVFTFFNIGAWYENPDRPFEQLLKRQNYIEMPKYIYIRDLLKYKEGKLRWEDFRVG